jgi:superfamily I DNA/RNA helicase
VLGISTGGRTHHLRSAYRSTVEIFEFTQRFIGEKPRAQRQLAILPQDFGLHGEEPSLHKLVSREQVEEFVVRDIRTLVHKGEYKRSEIAILYDDKVYTPDGFAYENRDLPENLLRKLSASGIPANWVSQDVRAKQLYDITTDRVSLISIHSSKGLDFDLVYLVGIDHIRPTEGTWRNLISLVYVAMTRAKYRLVIPYAQETELVAHIRKCLQK